MAKNNKKTAETPIIGAVRDYILTCPFLKQFENAFPVVRVEKMDEKAQTYMIESVPSDPVIKKYIDGSGIYKFSFVFASREFTETSIKEAIENCGFYQDLATWFEKNSREGILPDLGSTMDARKITAMTPGYVYGEDGETTQYQIQCELHYYKKVGGN